MDAEVGAVRTNECLAKVVEGGRVALLDFALSDHHPVRTSSALTVDGADATTFGTHTDLRFLVHLGLGPDGHTASLVPGDPVLDITDADVAATGSYHGRRRMTLTFPTINRCRLVLWLVTGGEKAAALVRLREGDRSIPASRVRQDRSLVLADRAAAEQLDNKEKSEAQQ